MATRPSLDPKTVLLLLLHAPGPNGPHEPIRGKTRMMKFAFLFEKELYESWRHPDSDPLTLFDFEAYDYGPFSEHVYGHLTALQAWRLISIEAAPVGALDVEEDIPGDLSTELGLQLSEDLSSQGNVVGDISDVVYRITDLGIAYLRERILPKLSAVQTLSIDALKARVLQASLRSLLRYVYTKYPQSATNSRIQGDILGSGRL